MPMKLFYRSLPLLALCALVITGITAPTAAQQPPPGPTPIPRPLPGVTLTQDGVSVDLLFGGLPQGRAGVVHVTGAGLTEVRGRFREQIVWFFPVEEDGFYGVIAAGIDQTPRAYELLIIARLDNGQSVTLTASVDVTLGGFIRQDFDIPPERAYLISPEIERAEFSRLVSVTETQTDEKLWDENGFRLPIMSALTSPYGAFRILNGTVETRHTGWDLRAAVGTPVMAMGAGRVAFAGLLEIRGYHIVIDHGHGIYSGYSHLSQIHVTRGQNVAAGQIIGVSGNTGRSSGAHLHWEVIVNGEWVDSADFIQMWLP